MKKFLIVISIICSVAITYVIAECVQLYIAFEAVDDRVENRLYFGASKLRETAKEFVKENVNTAEVLCYVDDHPSNIEMFEENNGELFSDEYVRTAFSSIKDELFDEMECYESNGTSFPARDDTIDNGYFAESVAGVFIPVDSDGAHIYEFIFHFDANKNLKIARIYIIKNEVRYVCQLLIE